MSQHPSLKSSAKEKAHRSVWKRFERLKFLVGKDKWAGGNSIFGLPKIKIIKLKIKKEKAEEAAKPAGAEQVSATKGAVSPAEGKSKAATTEGIATKGATGRETEAKTAKKPEKPEKK